MDSTVTVNRVMCLGARADAGVTNVMIQCVGVIGSIFADYQRNHGMKHATAASFHMRVTSYLVWS